MKKFVFLVSLSFLARAQTLTLTSSSASVKLNTPVTFTVTLSGSTGTNLSALEFTYPFPNSSLTTTIGAAGTAAGKTLFCNVTAAICVLAGLNQTAFADGIVATFTWTPTVSGTFIYNLTNISGASNAAKALAVVTTAGPAVSFLTISPCDINGDGVINIADIQAFLNTFVFFVPTAGTVNPIASGNLLVDIQRIATAGTTGGSCITGP